ncbi:MAG: hypothetical protein Q8P82_00110 [bacterium]|nr:hypothetical protein [bacterium]
MKNFNYNLVKLLHTSLDAQWRLDNFYVRDAKAGCKECAKLLAAMQKDVKRHVEALSKELSSHGKKNTLK